MDAQQCIWYLKPYIWYLLYSYLQIVPDPDSLQFHVRVVFLIVELAPNADGLVEVVANVEGGVVGGPVLVVDEPGHLLRARRVWTDGTLETKETKYILSEYTRLANISRPGR